MGLDNGIIIKTNKNTPAYALSKLEQVCNVWKTEEEENKSYELAYWRKCWGLRSSILHVLHIDDDYEIGGGSYSLDGYALISIARVIQKMNNKSEWEEYSDNLWDYEDMAETLTKQYNILMYIGCLWLENSEYFDSAEFYDSY